MIPIVRHISEWFIRPKYDVEEANNPIHLSPMELACLTVHYNQKGLLFTKAMGDDEPMADLLVNLKHSLSVALVHFYPLAGQLETQVDEDQHASWIFINCNKGPGARLVHATTEMRIADIMPLRYVPDVVQSSFFDPPVINYEGHTRPLLSIQVTRLADGVFIGCSMNHVCADGSSFWHFFNTWSEIFSAKGKGVVAISRPPIHKRWFIDGAIGPPIKLPFTDPEEFITRFEAPKLLARFFRFSAESIKKLKEKASEECDTDKKISSFQVLAAIVWRGVLRARRPQEDVVTKCKFHADYRGRVDPPLSKDYFGNLIQSIHASCTVGELLGQSIGWAALRMNKAVAAHTDAQVRSMEEGWMRSPYFHNLGGVCDPHCILIGSSPRFGMYGTEFGMGKALTALSGYANKLDGKVLCYPARQGGGSIDVEIYLKPETMRALESDEEFMGVAG